MKIHTLQKMPPVHRQDIGVYLCAFYGSMPHQL